MASVPPGDPAVPAAPPPFHPVRPMGRPDAATRAAVDGIGLHLVCAEARCRRARRCADPDAGQLPLCFWLHRGTCRFAAELLAARMGAGAATQRRHAEERPEGASRSTRDRSACFETAAPQPPQQDAVGGSVRPSRRRSRPDTVLGRLARAGWPIERLARSRADGADEWCWEREPDFAALVREARAASGRPNDRGTGDAALRSPANTGG